MSEADEAKTGGPTPRDCPEADTLRQACQESAR
jgi:hypothetical protein